MYEIDLRVLDRDAEVVDYTITDSDSQLQGEGSINCIYLVTNHSSNGIRNIFGDIMITNHFFLKSFFHM